MTFNSSGVPFNLVEITIPPAPLASSDFFVDNIQASRLVASITYHQGNLISDVAGLAANTDPNLVNPWGVAWGTGTPGTPWRVPNAGTGNVTVYDGNGGMIGTVVTVPAANGTGIGSPTGITYFPATSWPPPWTARWRDGRANRSAARPPRCSITPAPRPIPG